MVRPDLAGTPSATATSKLSPKRLYGFLAAAEMVTWALLIIAMVIKYGVGPEIYVRIFGMFHGVVFIAYGLVTIFVWANERWSAGRGILGLASAVVPFATLPFERAMLRRGLLSNTWRLAPGGDTPQGPIEKIQALALRSPWLAAVAGIVLVAAITAVLLFIGPPGGGN
ncbi:DUF3817 domain-containing protein [Paeniglutamicibacter psychrophenolicus]|uniref:DUF3817 domain-containing protein n=1 Tax=Paeniglutamicibacter psychrophenolicus TaxID=257454 RepID=UPI002786AF3E|nr:DUF3817 domain-containing protein [Paeniglutamicibacter psychrophenolicus]MDQ0095081.1 integral membrane protein [Paeniglutamicibacter psychrophenolicus]